MKRKLMLGLLSAVGGLTIIGSGFSAWYFGDKIVPNTQNVNAHVTPIADTLGTLTVTSLVGVELSLDQGGYANKDDATKGISFTYGTDGTFNSDIVANYNIEFDKSINVYNAGLKATFDCVITLKQKFAEYIEFKNTFYDEAFTTGTDAAGNTTITLSKDITYGAEINTSYTFHVATDADKVNKAFQYRSGKKPKTSGEHATLHDLNAYATDVLTFSFSLNVTNR